MCRYVGWTLCLALVVGGCAQSSGGGTNYSSSTGSDGNRNALPSGACFSDADCEGEATSCYGAMLDGENAGAGFCTSTCSEDADCAPMGGMAATCSPFGQCRVDCTGSGSGDGACPQGMVCRNAYPSGGGQVAYRCLTPVGTGAGNAGEWARCNPTHGSLDCAEGLTCVASGLGDESMAGYCGRSCDDDTQCAAPAGVNAAAICPAIVGACSLDCSAAGSTCPQGMQCIDANPLPVGDPIMRCRFAPAQGSADDV